MLGRLTQIDAIRHRAATVIGPQRTNSRFLDELCEQVERLFGGRLWHYQPIDLRYHDYQHTLQAAWVYLDLIEGASRAHLEDVKLPPRETELGLAAILLHDSGYLRAQGDDTGSGAKYTYCHVLRSCALAASLLPPLGCTPQEIDDVLGAIRCTGLTGNPAAAKFRTDNARLIACLVATSDYLGQMAAPEYPDKLPALFAEFSESDDYTGVPTCNRQFSSVSQLLAATRGFWTKFVLPKLEQDFKGVHRLLRDPAPDGPNPYFRAIEDNLAVIDARSTAPANA